MKAIRLLTLQISDLYVNKLISAKKNKYKEIKKILFHKCENIWLLYGK